MTALTRFFFRSPYLAPAPREIVHWWESRRPMYNVAVGIAGLITSSTITLSELLVTGQLRIPPWQAVAIYAVIANVAYSMGPAADLTIVRRWGGQFAAIGPALFRYGFVFAIGVTLLPIPLIVLSTIIRLLNLFE